MSNEESDRLLAPGVSITLRVDGEQREFKLVYAMLGLKALEDTFGSFAAATAELGNSASAHLISNTVDFLACGLMESGLTPHSTDPDPRSLELILEELTVALYSMCEPHRIPEYRQAVDTAIAQALQAPGSRSPNGHKATRRSRGAASTASPLSTVASASGSSGG